MADERPDYPVALTELAALAREQLQAEAADYVFGGSGAEETMRANEEAFARWHRARRRRRRSADRRIHVVGPLAGGRRRRAIASLEALPAIVDAVGGELQVLLGRPYLWGLAAGGEAGVLAVLRGMLAELDLTIGLSGHTRPSELDPSLLARIPS
jgi:isopentenyl diphosphate isomerase/L-lactate dehydrogenase-like FMN-dependent dehydrogenase